MNGRPTQSRAHAIRRWLFGLDRAPRTTPNMACAAVNAKMLGGLVGARRWVRHLSTRRMGRLTALGRATTRICTGVAGQIFIIPQCSAPSLPGPAHVARHAGNERVDAPSTRACVPMECAALLGRERQMRVRPAHRRAENLGTDGANGASTGYAQRCPCPRPKSMSSQ
jgi:hypothetical protein